MTTRSNTEDENPALRGPGCAALLQSEVEFWQEVIATCPVTQSEESLERMRQALALAESRLALMCNSSNPAVSPSLRVQ